MQIFMHPSSLNASWHLFLFPFQPFGKFEIVVCFGPSVQVPKLLPRMAMRSNSTFKALDVM